MILYIYSLVVESGFLQFPLFIHYEAGVNIPLSVRMS